MLRAALISILFAWGSSPVVREGFTPVAGSSDNATTEAPVARPLDQARDLIKQWSLSQRYAERCAIRDELVRLGPAAASAVLESYRQRTLADTPDNNEFLIGSLRRIGPAAVSAMLAELERGDGWGAHLIGRSLREFDGDAIETIINQSSSSNPIVRKNLVRVLSSMGGDDERVISVVARAARDESFEVRREAAQASVRKSPDVLRTLLLDSDKEVRAGALYSVELLGKDAHSLTDALLEILANEKEDTFIRGGAAYALGCCEFEPEKVVPALRRALAAKGLARTAAYGLSRLAPHAESAIPDLIKVIDEYDWYQGDAAAAEALAAIGEPSIGPLIEVLGQEAKRARFAAMALAMIKSPRVRSAVPALVACLNRNRFEHEAARELIWALESIAPDDASVVDAFSKIIESVDPSNKETWAPAQECLDSLGKFRPIPPVAFEFIGRYLPDTNSRLHFSAIRAAGNLGVDGARFSDHLVDIICDDSLYKATIEVAVHETATPWSRDFLDKLNKLQGVNVTRGSAAYSLSKTGFTREQQLDRIIQYLEQHEAAELIAIESSDRVETAISRVRKQEMQVARNVVSSLASAARSESKWHDLIPTKLNTRSGLAVAFCLSYFDERRQTDGELDEEFRRSVLENAIRMAGANGQQQARTAELIGNLRVANDDAISHLQNLAGHASSGVAGTAVMALARAAPQRPETRELIRVALRDERSEMREAGIRALGEIGPAAADDASLLLQFLKLGYRGSLAADSLGKIGVGEYGIREALEQAATSDEKSFAAAAQKALAKITEIQTKKERTESTGSSQ